VPLLVPGWQGHCSLVVGHSRKGKSCFPSHSFASAFVTLLSESLPLLKALEKCNARYTIYTVYHRYCRLLELVLVHSRQISPGFTPGKSPRMDALAEATDVLCAVVCLLLPVVGSAAAPGVVGWGLWSLSPALWCLLLVPVCVVRVLCGAVVLFVCCYLFVCLMQTHMFLFKLKYKPI
jgi:hypothetical protein